MNSGIFDFDLREYATKGYLIPVGDATRRGNIP
jgi:hypothetical protein